MLLVRASLGLSAIHGLGCFADEPIAQGQPIWVFHPAVDSVLQAAELDGLHPSAQAFLATYGYTPVEAADVVILCGDHARHMNHAAPGNVIRSERPMRYGEYVAARDISRGEELTCDYFDFDATAATKLKTGSEPRD